MDDHNLFTLIFGGDPSRRICIEVRITPSVVYEFKERSEGGVMHSTKTKGNTAILPNGILMLTHVENDWAKDNA